MNEKFHLMKKQTDFISFATGNLHKIVVFSAVMSQ
ncbi:hypothetical protein BN439_3773 [Erwinia amylovora Ea644]|uniref:Uncharacterized protein n=3 Tax=Erwinia amylovora TaxID=552 RepID=A0A831A2N9_ERWAM|nr:hypothetical protein EaACW_3553 [Erwinia amylovora ACW56400]QJQ56180.1 hypothetical protein EHX00_3481 [Erwinia amylovora]CBA23838.1 hypothetical protein predicted by Glimmer/Critica [Erwinia amylovora CFBP1430]CBX82412.1 hypothetical protein predicted by Glimmer/Critica [Erwinia amylovora ATCC BAA-2158]CCO80392.1 hypothetical protein BN432_3624 [Erwinia amylovora Ea356]CCO84198.1 hypothetical protein BN433_3653 [Erwinia amylovora Ea266]CCO87957.1 hypothetical protein BN434_3599 [Erwinia a